MPFQTGREDNDDENITVLKAEDLKMVWTLLNVGKTT